MRFCSLLAILFLTLSASGSGALAQSVEWQGEAAGWLTAHVDEHHRSLAGVRFTPTLALGARLGDVHSLNLELSAQAWGRHAVQLSRDPEAQVRLKAYRAWLRFSSPTFELRAGLQQISFGSATFLRPLMWFDRIDPRDPTQNTEGVWGLLARYYFLGNTNIWLWGLYGNSQPKGVESTPTTKGRPEAGGRIQLPLFAGEIALTCHHRSANWASVSISGEGPFSDRLTEQRIALDGKWDAGIGIWFEASYQHLSIPVRRLQSQTLATVGADYTFDVGNGLHTLAEYLHGVVGERLLGRGTTTAAAAGSLSYPVGVLDNVTLMVYSDVRSASWYRFAFWQRRTDDWTMNLMAFWNPEEFSLVNIQGESRVYAGKGAQVMVVLNY